jgi:Fe2+ or Zn2+ uptake regulation protein
MKTSEILSKAGIVPSKYRVAIFDYLCSTKEHPSAERIFDKTKLQYPGISLATIYNVLQILLENNLIHDLAMEKDKIHYDADTSCHSHFFCTLCRKIYDIQTESTLNKVFKVPEISHTIKRTQILYSGTCKNCK